MNRPRRLAAEVAEQLTRAEIEADPDGAAERERERREGAERGGDASESEEDADSDYDETEDAAALARSGELDDEDGEEGRPGGAAAARGRRGARKRARWAGGSGGLASDAVEAELESALRHASAVFARLVESGGTALAPRSAVKRDAPSAADVDAMFRGYRGGACEEGGARSPETPAASGAASTGAAARLLAKLADADGVRDARARSAPGSSANNGDGAGALLAELKRDMARGGVVAASSRSRNPGAEAEAGLSVDAAFLDPLMRSLLAKSEDGAPRLDALEIARTVLATVGTVEVSETVRFAGETVTVTREVDRGSAVAQQARARASRDADAAATATAAAAAASGLDLVVEGISKRRGITTVEKSSYDWDAYKREKALEGELKDAAKTGFVEREAFLGRVDERRFEIERAERERARAKRELAEAKARRDPE